MRPPRDYDQDFMAQWWWHLWGSTVILNTFDAISYLYYLLTHHV